MEGIFVSILNMSFQAGIAVCFVLLARWVFSLCRVPKKYACLLWLIPFIRFICPVSVRSVFSLLPAVHAPFSRETVERLANTAQKAENMAGTSGAALIDFSFLIPEPGDSVDPIQIYAFFCGCIWIAVMAGLLLYSGISLVLLVRRLRVRVRLAENIYLADSIDMPFVLGFVRPKIYLPSDLGKEETSYVVMHEQMHVKRRDAAVKAAAFLILVLHWFNPCAWAAFLCLGNDMEMACDEAVMGKLGKEACSGYAQTLLGLSAGRRRVRVIPLAFGEGNIKERVKNIMRYKKPLLMSGIFALAVSSALAVGLLTNPGQADGADLPSEAGTVREDLTGTWQRKPVQEEQTAGAGKAPQETAESIKVQMPQITEDTPLGADGAILDYADNGLIIFQGYFGLFVYSMRQGGMEPLDGERGQSVAATEPGIIGAVDLKAIGCDSTQGDNFCEVRISSGADKIYLHPYSEEYMYVYDIYRKTMTRQPCMLEDMALASPRYISREEIPGASEDICSPYGIAFGSGEETWYGYLISRDGTVRSLEYLETDMLVPLFLTPSQKNPVPITVQTGE